MTSLLDVRVAGSSYKLSLTKLAGLPVVDVQGYISNEFGTPTFKLTDVVLGDGTCIRVEGEHDFPYLTPDSKAPATLHEAAMEQLYAQEK